MNVFFQSEDTEKCSAISLQEREIASGTET